MVQSMTGYGKAIFENEHYQIQVELKSLNSKYADISVKLPKEFQDKELDIRNFLQRKLIRGKISMFTELNFKVHRAATTIQKDLFLQYYHMLKEVAESVGLDNQNVFEQALSMPEVTSTSSDNPYNEDLWESLKKVMEEATEKLSEFRINEGSNLKSALEGYIQNIHGKLQEIKKLDPERKKQAKLRLEEQLKQNSEVNSDRLEQELIYYYEKLDISEEMVRLESHLNYFLEELKKPNSGKKLGFIGQEIGREINTIGSKANNAEIQKLVVEMKDDLEKIKEQALNIL